jgi:hypothetical protein
MRCLYSPVKDRRLASATISGLGRGGADGWGETVLPAAVLRSVSLRSSSPRSAAGKTVGETEDILLFFTLISVLALLTNYDRENCLIHVGTEGMKEKKISKNRMAALLKTSRTQVDRLLDAKNDVTLSSLERAAAIVGRRVSIQLV